MYEMGYVWVLYMGDRRGRRKEGRDGEFVRGKFNGVWM